MSEQKIPERTPDEAFLCTERVYVPTLELDHGEELTEASVICQYLADQKAESGLAPKAGTMERYRLMEWLNFGAAEMHKQVGALFKPKYTPEMGSPAGSHRPPVEAPGRKARQQAIPDRRQFSVADAYAFTVLNRHQPLKIDLSPWPNIKDYYERIGKRPKVQEIMKAEGLA